MKDNINRFTDTVENYLRYRPSYPKEILHLAIEQCGLEKQDVIADIGSGTGFLAKLFLEHGNTVFGVEPNDAMQVAAKDYLKNYSNFHPISGTAENTTLQNQSIDVITAGTAFHWFDAKKTKVEFQRILKPQGWVLLIWNVRDIRHSAFMNDYENLMLKYGKNYQHSPAQEFDKTAVKEFFAPNQMYTASFKNSQIFDWQGLQGRLHSVSYSLRPREPGYDDMMAELKTIFDQHQKNNLVEFLYETKVVYGQLASAK